MRYIGNKQRIVGNIKKEILTFKKEKEIIFCDLFSGTGSVSDSLQQEFKIIANDNLYFSYALVKSKLCSNKVSFEKLELDPFDYFNNINLSDYSGDYVYNTFCPSVGGRMYFSDENGKIIDFIRNKIDEWYEEKLINIDTKEYLIGCLIESVSKVANVAGVYSAFLKTWDPRALNKMIYIKSEALNTPSYDNIVYNMDVNDLIKKIEGDILYLDPPYTATQYISQYHVLETIAKNDKPVFHGKGAHRDNGNQISMWSKKNHVAEQLYTLIDAAKFKYIIMSYSKDGLLDKEIIEEIFKRFAVSETYKFKEIKIDKYKSSRSVERAQKEGIDDNSHFEWLFIIEKIEKPIFASPINYIGGKYEIIHFLLNNFPKEIDTFYDIFGGGGSVSLNVEAKNIIYNDINYHVSRLLKYIKENSPSKMYEYIKKRIKKYKLEKADKLAYTSLRKDFNSKDIKDRHPLDFYLLIAFGFEHQIRFNSKMEFNNPCGNSGFNFKLFEKLISYSIESSKKNINYYEKSYLFFENQIKENDFVYCDPPYLITNGVYEDGKRGFNGWDENQQAELLDFLLRLNNRNIKFAMSNILERDGVKNERLIEWINANNFKVVVNDKITKRNRRNRLEVLIKNYE